MTIYYNNDSDINRTNIKEQSGHNAHVEGKESIPNENTLNKIKGITGKNSSLAGKPSTHEILKNTSIVGHTPVPIDTAKLQRISNKEVKQKSTLNGMDLSKVKQQHWMLHFQGLIPQLEEDKIAQMFEKELSNGDALESCLNGMLANLGVNINELQQEEIEQLTTLLLLGRNIPEQANTDLIMRSLLSSIITIAQNENPQFREKVLNEKKEFLDQFNFSDDMQSSLVKSPNNFQLADLIYLQSFLGQPDSLFSKTLENEIHCTLKDPCMKQFEQVCQELKQPDSLSEQQIVKKSLAVMAILNFLSRNLPVDDVNQEHWADLYYTYKEILDVKKRSKDKTVQGQLGKAFAQYQSLIEDGFVAYQFKMMGGSPEHVTKLLYGRNDQELEEIKSKNRAEVAQKLAEFSTDLKKGNPITIEMLSKLHSTNNNGIVPRHLSKLRKMQHENIQFGKRVGVIPKDVEPAVQEVLNTANQLLLNPPRNKLLYSIQVAKLHNKLLDIHPFMDRNGSTALIFMELLMTVHGAYVSPRDRIKNYNANLFKILNNFLAVAIVSYEHYKIAHRFGHYKSHSLKIDEETKKYYQKHLGEQKLRHKSEPLIDYFKKLWKDFSQIYKNAPQKK